MDGPWLVNGELRFDYSLMQKGAIHLFWRPPVLDRAIERLLQLDYRVIELGVAGLSADTLLDAFADAVPELPRHYFGNYNAFQEALFDLDYPVGGVAVALRGFDSLAARAPDDARLTLDIIEEASRLCLVYARRLLCFVQLNDPTFDVGTSRGARATWNDAEWLNASREPASDPKMVWWMTDE